MLQNRTDLRKTLKTAWLLYKPNCYWLFIAAFIAAVIRNFAIDIMWRQIDVYKYQTTHQLSLSTNGLFIVSFCVACVMLAVLVVSAISILHMHNKTLGKSQNLAQLMLILKQKFWQLLAAELITNIMFAVGLLLYVIPGFIVGTLLFVYKPSILFTNKNFIESIKYNFHLIKPDILNTFTLFCTSFFLFWLPSFITMMLAKAVGLSGMSAIIQVVYIFLWSITFPIALSIILSQFYNLVALKKLQK